MSKKTQKDSADVEVVPSVDLPKDMANENLVKKLQGAVRESELRDFLVESALMISGGSLTARGWNRTIEEANSSVGFKPSWGSYVVRASYLLGVKGSERFAVSVLFNSAITASKFCDSLKEVRQSKNGESVAFSIEKFQARIEKAKKNGETLAELITAWDVEAKNAKESRKDSPNKSTGAESVASVRPAESVDEVVAVARAVAVTGDSVVSLALGLLRDIEGEAAVIRDRATLGQLIETLKILSTPAHPVVKSKATA